MAAPAAAAEPQVSGELRPPVCLLVLGMAGSGKTTFVQVTCAARAWLVCARGCDAWKARENGREVSGALEGTSAALGDLPGNSGFFLGEAFSVN